MSIAPITTHVPDALSRLLEQYRGKPRITGIITAIAGRVQELEDTILQVQSARLLFGGQAVGAQLDAIGGIVGLARNGLGDALYTVLLLGTIAQNNADGTEQSLLTIAETIFQSTAIFISSPNSACHARRSAFSEVVLGVGSPQTDMSLLPTLIRILKNSLAAGVSLVALIQFNASGAFACSGPQPWVQGLGDVNNASTGGPLATLAYSSLAK